MAFSTLEKLMAAAIGIDLAVPGTSRKVVEAALKRVYPAAAAAPKPEDPHQSASGALQQQLLELPSRA